MKWFSLNISLTCFLLTIGFADSAQCQPEARPTDQNAAVSDGMELIWLAEQRPLRLRIHTIVDGQSVEQRRRDFFRRLFMFLDRDGDGTLRPVEAARAPSAEIIRQWSWGYFRMLGTPPGIIDSPPASDGQLSYDAFLSKYVRSGIGGVIVTGTPCRSSERLTDQLLFRLDQNRDGQVSPPELLTAEQALRGLDVNGDELIASGELAFQVDSPYPLATTLLQPVSISAAPISAKPPVLVVTGSVAPELWAGAVIEQYDRNGDSRLTRKEIGSSRAGFTALDDDKDNRLDTGELRKWRDMTPDYSVAVRLDGASNSTVDVLHEDAAAQPGGGAVLWASADSHVEMRVHRSRLDQHFRGHCHEMTRQFAALDADGNRKLSVQEITDGDAPTFESLLALADRDEDGMLSEGEQAKVLSLQQRAVASHVRLSILEHGRSLFSAIDTDRDGCLSIPDLRAASRLLPSENAEQNQKLDPAKLSRHYSLIFSRGQPMMNAPKKSTDETLPAWFLPMDVNSDGVVSRSEFLGDSESFDKYDKNEDGLLTPKEATLDC